MAKPGLGEGQDGGFPSPAGPVTYELTPWSPVRRARLKDFTTADRGVIVIEVGTRLLRVAAPAYRIEPSLVTGDLVTLLAFDDGSVSVFREEEA